MVFSRVAPKIWNQHPIGKNSSETKACTVSQSSASSMLSHSDTLVPYWLHVLFTKRIFAEANKFRSFSAVLRNYELLIEQKHEHQTPVTHKTTETVSVSESETLQRKRRDSWLFLNNYKLLTAVRSFLMCVFTPQ